MRNYLISDVLEGQAKLTTKVDKIAYLRKMNSAPLRDILRINFDDDIISMLPAGAPPYKKDDMPDGMNYATLQNQYRKFKYFFKISSDSNFANWMFEYPIFNYKTCGSNRIISSN